MPGGQFWFTTRGAPGIQWAVARDANTHPSVRRTVPSNEDTLPHMPEHLQGEMYKMLLMDMVVLMTAPQESCWDLSIHLPND